ncbi:MAG: type II toxin-antitoxin system Phd/YefM family antitoxin [Clostridia bacterium]|nr:type II toxin-antitoxin system Phd/YefM family antitoxin [Clostridia bacterium]
MKILAREIVSNSEMIQNYKRCKEKAEEFGKIFILKNNQPDAVLFSIKEYQRLSVIIEYLESLEDKEMAKAIRLMPEEGGRRTYTIEDVQDSIVHGIKKT